MDIISSIVNFLVDYYQLLLILPIIVALKAEKHYVGRASILANTVGMFAAVAPNWESTHSWLNINGISVLCGDRIDFWIYRILKLHARRAYGRGLLRAFMASV